MIEVNIYDSHPDNALLISYITGGDSIFDARITVEKHAEVNNKYKGKRLWVDFTRVGEDCPLTHINITGGDWA